MRRITLTQGKVALVDNADYEHVSQFKWCALKQKAKNTYYAVRATPRDADGKQTLIYMHVFLLGGPADHANGNRLDNRRSNIHLATQRQNQRSFLTKSVGCSSQYRGVSWNKRDSKWQVGIRNTSGKSVNLGYFDDEIEAARAYNVAALARDPKFFHLNKI